MKITDIQTACLAIPMKPLQPPIGVRPGRDAMRKQIVVRLLTDEGISGLGEAFAYGPPLAVCNVIEEGSSHCWSARIQRESSSWST